MAAYPADGFVYTSFCSMGLTKAFNGTKGSPAKLDYIDVIAWSEDGGLAYTIEPSDLGCLASLGVLVCFSFADYPDNKKE